MAAISFAGWLGNMAAILSSIDMLVVDVAVVVDVLVVARVVLVSVVEGAVVVITVVKGVVVVTVCCVVDVDGAKGVGLSI